MLSPLTSIGIGHDDSGEWPNWYCEHVIVLCQTTGFQHMFPCNKWLSNKKGESLVVSLQENTEFEVSNGDTRRTDIKRAIACETCLPNTKKEYLKKKLLNEARDLHNDVLHQICKEHGRKSDEVAQSCGRIRLQILSCSRFFKDVWPTYKPDNPDDIVLCFFLRTRPEQDVVIPESLESFDIIYRMIGEYSNEDNKTYIQTCLEKDHEHRKNLTDILQKNSSELMKSHSNLNIITASPFKLKASTSERHSIPLKPNITFYVSVKGYIPIQEEELPRVIGTYETVVREGAFTFYNGQHVPEPYIQRLRIGCSFGENYPGHFGGTGGTLGAFVNLPNGSVGCITSAHTLLSEYKMNERKNGKNSIPENLSNTIFQPDPSIYPNPGRQPFGRVATVVYKTGENARTGVEVGLITICDQNRYPENGKFPFVMGGFTKENQLNYMSGEIYTSVPDSIRQYSFYKYGVKTGLTRGVFNLHGCALRTSEMDVYPSCKLFNQIEIHSVGPQPFAKPGDSGALVLVAHENNQNDLRAIGILTGGTTDCTLFHVTPIWEVLNALGLSLQLKQFSEHLPMMIDDENGNLNPSLNMHDVRTNLEKFKRNINSKVDKINTDLTAKVDKVKTIVRDKVGQVETKIGSVEHKVDRICSEMSTKSEMDAKFANLVNLLTGINPNRSSSNT